MFLSRLLMLAILCVLLAPPPAQAAIKASPTTQLATHKFFSRYYGETWVRLNFGRMPYHGWRLDAGTTIQGLGVSNAPIDLASDAFLWCLVGDASGFKLYNKVAGAAYAVTSPEVKEAAALTFTTVDNATLWQLDKVPNSTTPRYTLHPVGATKTFSPNSYGGDSGPIKYYATADNGSHWYLSQATQRVRVNVRVEGNTQVLHPQTQSRIAELFLHAGDGIRYRFYPSLGQTHYDIVVGDEPLTLPTPRVYRNFVFKGFEGLGTPNITAYFAVGDTTAHYLFYNPDTAGIPPRIPAIATAKNGDLIAVSDYRYCFADIGMGDGRIDLIQRVSRTNGTDWSDIQTIIAHDPIDPHRRGYGDAAIVADRERNEVLLMAVTGNVSFWASKRQKPIRLARLKGVYNPATHRWTYEAPIDLTEHVYHETFGDSLRALFLTSGKLFQSRVTKVGKYYRIYGAFCVFEVNTGKKGTYVAYTDDFGLTWHQLGNGGMAALRGDEAKCEEFPDGTVILSSRSAHRRIFNIFVYDKGKKNLREGRGRWLGQSDGIHTGDSPNGTNGEIGVYDAIRTADGKRVKIILQSTPTNNRNDVSIYYKELTDADKDASVLGTQGWQRYQVSHGLSAYSTFDVMPDGRLAFYVEENDYNGGYDMVFLPLDLRTITRGAYRLVK